MIMKKVLDEKTKARIEEIISELTIEQKIGQMTQCPGWAGTAEMYKEKIRKGMIGSLIIGVPDFSKDESNEKERLAFINELQKCAVEESPGKIPLMFGADVIHGYNVAYPVPLGMAATFDPELVAKCYRNIATETARDGLNWTFTPVMDLAHDPRWGRCVEGFGEDPCLAYSMGAATVRGLQGQLDSPADLISCAKHFIGYGAMEGARDYHNSDISDYILNNWYAKGFSGAVDEGALTVMSSFNAIGGQPVTSSKKYLRQLLREKMGFEGFVISDWDAVTQLKNQGVSDSDRESARLGAEGGVDMEMVQNVYAKYLAELVQSGEFEESVLDEAVRHILYTKFAAGLFDRPYKEHYSYNIDEHIADARRMCAENAVLLKNNGILPLKPGAKVMFSGPFTDERQFHVGAWSGHFDLDLIKTYREAAEEFKEEYSISFCGWDRFADHTGHTAQNDKFDAVVLFLGESSHCTGEAVSVTDLSLPEDQLAYARKIKESGRPVIAVINCGRPRALGNAEHLFDAIIYGWHNGTMATSGMLDVIFGKVNPCGHLPMTLPRVTGQVPIYYNAPHAARPVNGYYGEDVSYWDSSAAPLYPFGYGLSYTSFEFSNFVCENGELSLDALNAGETFKFSVEVKNAGELDGKEVVQLYVTDQAASMQRPMRQLCKFEKRMIRSGESEKFTFELGLGDLGFYGADGEFAAEKGAFTVYVGDCCLTENKLEIRLV